MVSWSRIIKTARRHTESTPRTAVRQKPGAGGVLARLRRWRMGWCGRRVESGGEPPHSKKGSGRDRFRAHRSLGIDILPIGNLYMRGYDEKTRIDARDAGYVDFEDADAGAVARVWDRAIDQAGDGRAADGGGRVVVSGVAAAAAARVGEGGMEEDGDEAAGAVLHADRGGAEAVGRGIVAIRADGCGDWKGFAGCVSFRRNEAGWRAENCGAPAAVDRFVARAACRKRRRAAALQKGLGATGESRLRRSAGMTTKDEMQTPARARSGER
jgi:hypothetical protein